MATRSYTVTRAEARQTLLEWTHHHFSLSWKEARSRIKDGQISVDGAPCRNPRARLEKGQRIEAQVSGSDKKKEAPRQEKPLASGRPVVRFVDREILVVEKPSGLTTMRYAHEVAEQGKRAQEFLPPTLLDLLPGLLPAEHRDQNPRAVHRLDKDTSGLLVFAMSSEAERHLNDQFRCHTVERHYQAIVRGRVKAQRVETKLVRDRGDGRRGSSDKGDGQRAVTHIVVMEKLGDYTLVECRLETGRTHQVRIHLGELGAPICGERVYDRPVHGKPFADHSGAQRVALHAASLGIVHPKTGEQLCWTSPLPKDMTSLLHRLRQQAQ